VSGQQQTPTTNDQLGALAAEIRELGQELDGLEHKTRDKRVTLGRRLRASA
jgi:hypothetical protein